MSWGDQNYKEACIHYEKGELEEALSLFSKAIDSFFRSSENEKEAKAYYYRGCTYYRLGIQCEKNQMFEESKENFDKALDDFKEVIKKINELSLYKLKEIKQEFDSALNKFKNLSEKINKDQEIKTDLDDALNDAEEVSKKSMNYLSIN